MRLSLSQRMAGNIFIKTLTCYLCDYRMAERGKMFKYIPNPNFKFDKSAKFEAINQMAWEYTIQKDCEQCEGKNLDKISERC